MLFYLSEYVLSCTVHVSYVLQVMENKKWTRAVWIEGNQEEEGVVPTSWIDGKTLRWPFGCSATQALKDQRPPEQNRLTFKLLKINLIN